METTLQNFLTQISAITKKYDEIAKITGENFNVFRVLKVEASEVRMHSAFLAELLNPQGSHGQEGKLLELFITQLNIDKFDISTAIVEVEKYTGIIDKDYTKGGRIDIVITDNKGQHILIENKIYAGDQKNQLSRYHEFDKNANLYYLTLFGKEPSEWSTGEKLKSDKDFKTISYRYDILAWLMDCRKQAVMHSILRESITQYINLIKYLTGQTINDKMEKEIKNTILKGIENFKGAEQIAIAYPDIKKEIHEKFLSELTKVSNEKFSSFKVEFEEYNISFEIAEENDEVFFNFYATKGEDRNVCNDEKLKPFVKFLLFKHGAHSLGWKFPQKIQNFYRLDAEIIYNLYNEEFRKSFINDIIKEAESYVNQFSEKANIYIKSSK